MFRLLVVDIVDVGAVGEQQELGEVVEDDPDAVVVEAVAEAVLVAVVDPLADPGDGLGLGILALVLHGRHLAARLRGDQLQGGGGSGDK